MAIGRERGYRRAFIQRRQQTARDPVVSYLEGNKLWAFAHMPISKWYEMARQTASHMQESDFFRLTDSLLTLSAAMQLPPETFCTLLRLIYTIILIWSTHQAHSLTLNPPGKDQAQQRAG